MIPYFDVIEFGAFWGRRREDLSACARRTETFLRGVQEVASELGDWHQRGKSIIPLDAATVSDHLKHKLTDVLPKRPVTELGYFANPYLQCRDEHLSFSLHCGSWAIGNHVHTNNTPKSRKEDYLLFRGIILSAIAAYEPENAHVFSRRGSDRNRANKQPFPFVDWMIYLGNATIPAEELPMVHAVEHIGGGTLVTLKPERLHLDRLEDLALVEAVEPIIRRHQPPQPTQRAPQALQ